jgi:cytochrome c
VSRAAAGSLIVLALLPVPPGPAGADPLRGERVFQRCYACHSVLAGEEGLPGPNLRCVLGRRAGTLPGFEFSPAMVSAGLRQGLIWTRATLDAFLLDPPGVVPGTTMGMPGLPGDGDRQDVMDFIERAGSCPPAAKVPEGQP